MRRSRGLTPAPIQLMPPPKLIELSATGGAGVRDFIDWLELRALGS